MRFTKLLSIVMALAIVAAGALPSVAQGRGGGGKGGGGKSASAAKSGSKQSAKVAAKKDGSDGAGSQVRAKKEYAPVPPKKKVAVKASTPAKPSVAVTPPVAKLPPAVTPKPLGPMKPPPGVIKPGPNYPLHPAYPSAKHPLHGHRFWNRHPWIYGGGGSSSIVYGDFDIGCADCGCEIVAVIDESDTCVNPSAAIRAERGAYELVVVRCPGDEENKIVWMRR